MARQKAEKTNAMRILESLKIPYSHYTYACKEFTDGVEAADALGLPHEQVYKTLVTRGSSKQYFVFVIPVEKELDLKKAAQCAAEKRVELIPVKELFAVTGYVRGGCTAIGMKKQYRTFLDSSAREQETILVSGGKIGSQIELGPADFCRAAEAELADITRVLP